jgi:hypothetical protein
MVLRFKCPADLDRVRTLLETNHRSSLDGPAVRKASNEGLARRPSSTRVGTKCDDAVAGVVHLTHDGAPVIEVRQHSAEEVAKDRLHAGIEPRRDSVSSEPSAPS